MKKDFDKWNKAKNTEGNPSVSFVRRQVESNHILQSRTKRVSISGQNHLTSTSSNLRSFNYTNDKTKSNIFNIKDVAPSFIDSRPPTDTHYNKYTQSQDFVNTFIQNLWINTKNHQKLVLTAFLDHFRPLARVEAEATCIFMIAKYKYKSSTNVDN